MVRSAGRAGGRRSSRCPADVRKVVLDTNVYVDWLNERRHEAVVFEVGTIRYLSGIVLMELAAGVRTPKDRKILRSLFSVFRRAGRILLPSASVFEESGEVLSKLRDRLRYDTRRASLVAHDVLIALSARSIGATVVTQNASDFEAIRSVRRFSLSVVG